MGSVVIDMSMSLDGYIAAPDDNPEQGLGEDGMRLHNRAFDDPSVADWSTSCPAGPPPVRHAPGADRAGTDRAQPDRRRDPS
jgi:hypothetical protein